MYHFKKKTRILETLFLAMSFVATKCHSLTSQKDFIIVIIMAWFLL